MDQTKKTDTKSKTTSETLQLSRRKKRRISGW
jgi:hypothetical protein